MKTVKEVLERKQAPDNFIHSNATVITALNKLMDVNLSYLIVKDGEDVIGVFSERDYTRKVILKGRTSFDTRVGEIMSTDLPEVSLTDSLQTCMDLLASNGRRYLLVKDNGSFKGVITIHDLLREILKDTAGTFDNKVANALIDINEKPKIQ